MILGNVSGYPERYTWTTSSSNIRWILGGILLLSNLQVLVYIGADATILDHSVLMRGSRVGEGETWCGVPARRLSREEMEHFKERIR